MKNFTFNLPKTAWAFLILTFIVTVNLVANVLPNAYDESPTGPYLNPAAYDQFDYEDSFAGNMMIVNAVCQDLTVVLNESGMAQILPLDVNNGSSSDVPIDSYTIDIGFFNISHVGENIVTLTIRDVNGNEGVCTSIVTVVNPNAPIITCPSDAIVDCNDSMDPTDTGMATATNGCMVTSATSAWINEFHYDNNGTDTGEFVEIAGPAGLDLTDVSIVLYNGSNPMDGVVYNTLELSGVIPDEGDGVGAQSFPFSTIQNGAPDGIALVDADGAVLEFISYEGVILAGNGPANGMTSLDVEVTQPTAVGTSIQREGMITNTAEFSWSTGLTESPGALNSQTVILVMSDIEITNLDGPLTGSCPSQFTRTFTATDVCGNTSTCEQTITVEDTAAPVVTNIPTNLTLSCIEELSSSTHNAIDACQGDIQGEVINVRTLTAVDECDNNPPASIERTLRFQDGCGNTAIVVQLITLSDTTAPIASNVPMNVSINCEDDLPVGEPAFTDICDANISIDFTESDNGLCPLVIERTWIATDYCGNATTVTQTITVTDTTDPIIICPDDISVECNSDIPAAANTIAELDAQLTTNPICALTQDIGFGNTGPLAGAMGDLVNAANAGANDHSGPMGFDLWDESTGIAGPGGLDDISITFDIVHAFDVYGGAIIDPFAGVTHDITQSTSGLRGNIPMGSSGTTESSTGDVRGYTIRVDFASHMNVNAEDLQVLLTSVNTMGEAWESSSIVFLDPSGNPYGTANYNGFFSTPPLGTNGGSAMPIINPSPWAQTGTGVYLAQDQSVIDIITNPFNPEGTSNGASNNFDPISSTDAGLAVGSPVGGFIFNVRLEDVAESTGDGIETSTSTAFTSTLNGINFGKITFGDAASSVTDNCGINPNSLSHIDVSSGSCPEVITRTYTVVDACGNTGSCDQTITVDDTTAPMLDDAPTDTTVECIEDLPEPEVLTATDNCDADVDVTFSQLIIEEEEICALSDVVGTNTNVWSILLNGLPGLSNFWVPVADGIVFTTYNDGSALMTGKVQSSTNPGQIFDVHLKAINKRTYAEWTALATSPAGNSNRTHKDDAGIAAAGGDLWTTWDYYELDNTDSYLTGEGELAGSLLNMTHAPDNFQFGWQIGQAANNVNANYGMSTWFFYTGDIVVDGVATNDIIGNGDINTDNNCVPSNNIVECEYDVTYKWTATDDCGNVTSTTQVITIEDTTAPVVSNVPDDVTVECYNALPTGAPEFTDNCDTDLTIDFDEVVNAIDCLEEIVRTWTATDDCGNATTVTQTITRVDTTVPEIDYAPEDYSIECGLTIPDDDAFFFDDCDDDFIVAFTEVTNALDCQEEVVRTWTATDACGNESIVTQTITVLDTTPPAFDCAMGFSNSTYTIAQPGTCTIAIGVMNLLDSSFDSELWIDNVQGGGLANGDFENGDLSSWNNLGDVLVQDGGVNGDFNAALMAFGSDQNEIETTLNLSPNALDGVVGDAVDGSVIYQSINANVGDEISIDWRFFANDGGDWNDFAFVVICQDGVVLLADHINPTGIPASCLPDETYECMDDVPASGMLAYTDNCGMTGSIEGIDSSDGQSCPTIITRTWTATDDCGNTTSTTQEITIEDTIAPTLEGVPANATVECGGDVLAPAVPVASDNCDTAPAIDFEESSEVDGCITTITRTWTVSDDCDNVTVYTQEITIADTTAPMISCPTESIALGCNPTELPTTDDALALVSATDNCGIANITAVPGAISGSLCFKTRVFQMTATDDCGNSATCNVTYSWTSDEDAPVFDCPSEDPVDRRLVSPSDFGDGATLINFEELGATNQMLTNQYEGTHGITFSTVNYNPNPNPPAANVPYYYHDNNLTPPAVSGNGQLLNQYNFATGSIKISFDDAINRVGFYAVSGNNDIANVQINCIANGTVVDVMTFPEIDQNWTFIGLESANGFNEIEIIVPGTNRPFRIDDLYFELHESIGIIDLGCNPMDADSNDIPDDIPTTLSYTDNCSADGDISVYVDSDEILTGCDRSLTRTFTTTDDCGNTANCTTSYSWKVDTEDPEITCPADIEFDCDVDETLTGEATATDNCGVESIVSSDDLSMFDVNGCGLGVITRTWTATDSCGNNSSCDQIITVVDTVDPVVVCPPDVTVECYINKDELVPATAYDNCTSDDEIVITYVLMEEDVNECGLGLYKCLATATDCAGNTSTSFNTITVIDTTAPVITVVDMTFDCEEGDVTPATAIDNCELATIDLIAVPTAVIVPVIINTVPDLDSCGYGTIVYTWEATDCAGNSSTMDQTITIEDTEAPVITCPADVTFDCAIDEAAAGVATATDNCAEGVNISYADNADALSDCGLGDVIRTWTAIDCAGNESSCVQTITIVDTLEPAIQCPLEITVECDVDLLDYTILGYPSGWDICTPMDELVYTHFDILTDLDDCGLGPIWRQWTVTDCAGNASTGEQIINLVDTTVPVIVCADDRDVECGMPIVFDMPTATDNCTDPANIIITATDSTATFNDCGLGIYMKTWTATDCSGLTATCSQTLTVIDTTAPVITCPADIGFQCEIGDAGLATATDVCDGEIDAADITFADVSDGLSCPETITRTWTAIDCSGNESTCSQTIIIDDTMAPVLSAMPGDVIAECDNVPAIPTITATDNCDVDPTLTVVSNTVPGACEDAYSIVTTWTATDACDNIVTHTQTITVVDTTDPEFDELPPVEITAPCDNIPEHVTCTATDNCDTDVSVDYSEQMFSGGCAGVIERTWVATDNCGNSVTFVQFVTLTDDVDPVLVGVPMDLIIECDEAVPPVPAVTATDNCDDTVDPTFSESTAPGNCPNEYVITRTWTSMDHCDNVATGSYTITILDTTDPTFVSVPSDVTIECDQPVPMEMAAATDNCGTVEVTLSSETVPGDCPNESIITNTFTATDICGNTATATQTITIEDTTPPSFLSVPPNITVECDEDVPTTPATCTDNCGTSSVTYADVTTGDDCLTTIIRTFTAADACGNTSTATQTITIEDSTPPIFLTVPIDIMLECDQADPMTLATATDVCNSVTVEFNDVTTDGACENEYSIVRTFTATDACGNTITATQNITVQDSTVPTLIVGDDVTVQCDAEIPAPSFTATDNCDTDVSVTVDPVVTPGCGNTFVMVRTYTAEDNCGNTTTATQTITVEDTIAPEIIISDDVTIDCGTEIPYYWYSSTDNCDLEPIVTVEADTVYTCENSFVLTRVYTSTDDCGNATSATHVITVEDTTAPEIVISDDITIDCGTEIPYYWYSSTDNCDLEPIVTVEADTVYTCENSFVLTRVYTSTDDCGNATSATHVITVEDTTAPEIVISDDITIDCGTEIPYYWYSSTDNCDNEPIVTVEADTVYSCANSFVLTRIYTSTDDCGNATSATHVITVEDTFAPTLDGVPANATVECEADVLAPAVPVASDNCDPDPAVDFNESSEMDGCIVTITRTWTVTDDCGNATVYTQLITVEDTTAPVVETTLADATVECSDALPTDAPTFSDNCDDGLTIEMTETEAGNGCPLVYTRIWTATDDCGNATSTTQVITVNDTEAPTFDQAPPIDIDVPCDNIPSHEDLVITATDNCDDQVDVVITDELLFSGGCLGVIERTCTATDDCGNSTSFVQYLNLFDSTVPVVETTPADVTIECDMPLPVDEPTWSDNCDDNLDITFEEVESGDGCPLVITRTWTATDHCQNITSTTQVITVNDTTAPELIISDDITIDCGAEIPYYWYASTDNCDIEPIVTVEADTVYTCENSFVLTRIYTSTDDCGNATSATHIITVEDTTAPVVETTPADVTIECDMPLPTDEPTWSDNCDTDVTIAFEEVESGDGCPLVLTRTWTATDDCGNATSTTQVITIEDTTAPVVETTPADVTIECDMPLPTDEPTWSDNCDTDVTITFEEVESGDGCPLVLTRTWTGTDDCGNATSTTQVITIEDTTAPVVETTPADVTIECGMPLPTDEPTWSDNCDTDVTITFEEVESGNGCNLVLTRMWTATDDCGNPTSTVQVITIVDNSDPTFVDLPESEITVQCVADIPAPNLAAIDNCDTAVDVEFSESDPEPGQGFSNEEICNIANAANATQNRAFVLFDLPGLTDDWNVHPDGLTFVTAEDGSANLTGKLVASDDPTKVFLVDINVINKLDWDTWSSTLAEGSTTQYRTYKDAFNLAGPGLLYELWDYYVIDMDNSFFIGLEGLTGTTLSFAHAPESNIFGWQVGEAANDVNANIGMSSWLHYEGELVIDGVSQGIVQGNGDINVDMNCTQLYEIGCNQDISRTWTATDDCGNSTTFMQTIHVEDNEAPEFMDAPSDITLECGQEIPAPADVLAVDNCDMDVSVTMTEVQNGVDCPYTITRTWTAQDNCGNETETTQIISVLTTTTGLVQLDLKVFLQGPTNVATGLMNDALRSIESFPLTEPYAILGFEHYGDGGGETILPSVLEVEGDNAVVDWIMVELRDVNDPTVVLQTKSALLQSDGDVVDVDGISNIFFSGVMQSSVYVSIQHRNHLCVRTGDTQMVTGVMTIDFSNANFNVHGGQFAMTPMGQLKTMVSGDASKDGQVNAVDKNLHWRLENNSNAFYDYFLNKSDFNMDGAINAVDKNAQWRPNNNRVEFID